MKTYYIESYGCTANQVDGEILSSALERAGYRRVYSPHDAELVLLNTCAVKTKTEEHMISRIRKLPKDKLVVVGCLADVNPDRIRELGVKHIFGPRKYRELSKVLGIEIPSIKTGREYKGSVYHSVFIEEGCLSACTFCATRFARGRTTSFPPESIIKEIEQAVIGGAKEIRLTGQDTGTYGRDIGTSLVELLNNILDRVEGDYRIRVGMMSPEHAIALIDEGYLELFRDERLFTFFHLPVQSGNDRILSLMGRKYTSEEFRELVKKIRKYYPSALIETDVIVGFPGEDWEAFLDTVRLIEELEIDVVNISRFSPRINTPAASFRGQVSSNEKKRRSKIITEVHERVSMKRYSPLLGKEVKVLITEKSRWNRARMQNYRLVMVKGGEIGSFANVKIREVTPRHLVAEPV